MRKKTTTTPGERKKLSARIREAREASHISQMELARALGVSDKSISAYEKARSTPPVEKLKKIALKTNKTLLFFTGEKTDRMDIISKLNLLEREFNEIKGLLIKLEPEGQSSRKAPDRQGGEL